MNKALETLKGRGFFQQCTDLARLSAVMDAAPITFYVGCDPTGSSLHIGHLVPFFAFRHLRATGHSGIALIGGGTARIGDPSGKTEMRRMLSYEQLDANAARIERQLDRFIGFDGKTARTENNKAWLAGLNYIDFLRDIGSCFSVNKMLAFESYRKRLETGLSFIEFNYQLLQSYDFLMLRERHNCVLQIGGGDQWGNIVAGADLIRRKTGGEAFGLTFPLVTRSDGKKMGKTEQGAVFLDPALTPVYDFFQYWRNVADEDVRKFLLLFTFLPLDEVEALSTGDVNAAKERLAYEATRLIHGALEADRALAGARAAFGGGDREALPAWEAPRARLDSGYPAAELFADCGLCASKSEARRLIRQGGAFASDSRGDLQPLGGENPPVGSARLDGAGGLLLRAGKKRFCRILAR
jgi:tyrosyl-tRNA synthetase